MRQMFEFVSLVGQQVAKTLNDQILTGGEDSFEFKALSRKFTVDVIASTAFGIEVNSFANPMNDFHQAANKLNTFGSMKTMIKIVGHMVAPSLMNMLNIKVFDTETCAFFSSAIIDTMRVREEKGIVRNDMINLLMQAKKGQLTHMKEADEEKIVDGFATVQESHVGNTEVTRKWTDEDLIAQCFIFFFAGGLRLEFKSDFRSNETFLS